MLEAADAPETSVSASRAHAQVQLAANLSLPKLRAAPRLNDTRTCRSRADVLERLEIPPHLPDSSWPRSSLSATRTRLGVPRAGSSSARPRLPGRQAHGHRLRAHARAYAREVTLPYKQHSARRCGAGQPDLALANGLVTSTPRLQGHRRHKQTTAGGEGEHDRGLWARPGRRRACLGFPRARVRGVPGGGQTQTARCATPRIRPPRCPACVNPAPI
jgi:hypothetical protein